MSEYTTRRPKVHGDLDQVLARFQRIVEAVRKTDGSHMLTVYDLISLVRQFEALARYNWALAVQGASRELTPREVKRDEKITEQMKEIAKTLGARAEFSSALVHLVWPDHEDISFPAFMEA